MEIYLYTVNPLKQCHPHVAPVKVCEQELAIHIGGLRYNATLTTCHPLKTAVIHLCPEALNVSDGVPCWQVFKECRYCGLSFLPGEIEWVSYYCLCKNIYPLCGTDISFQLFQQPLYLGLVFFIDSLYIETGTGHIIQALFFLLVLLQVSSCKSCIMQMVVWRISESQRTPR